MPPIPDTLSGPDCRDALLQFRKTQETRSKFFTNDRQDFLIVSTLLEKFSAKQALKQFILDGNSAEVERIFCQMGLFCDEYTQAHLASEVVDGYFNTPLHLAIEAGSQEMLELLLVHEAVCSRNLAGDFPWEWYGVPVSRMP